MWHGRELIKDIPSRKLGENAKENVKILGQTPQDTNNKLKTLKTWLIITKVRKKQKCFTSTQSGRLVIANDKFTHLSGLILSEK